MADNLFDQADLNKDQQLDLNEFRGLLTQQLGAGSVNTLESSLVTAYGNTTNLASAEFAGGETSFNSYEQASDAQAGGLNTSSSSGFNVSLAQDAFSGANLTAGAAGYSSLSTLETTNVQQQVQVDASNPQNLYQDPNPQIIRRPAQSGLLTYTQNVKVRFLQPPPVPPPGPLIIKEVRPPQPPPPPPLRVRQQAPPLPPPPPLVLREKPPVAPAAVASQTVIRRLAALPLPPRSVIIERLPPLPPKPRDIIIERWIPYGPQAKRKTIVQRAAAAVGYPKPRNIIIQYEPIKVRVVRQFHRLGITQENPQIYIQRYGIALLDAQTLVQQARAAGVIEDISPPASAVVTSASSSSFNAEFASGSSGLEAAGADAGLSVSSFDGTSYGLDQTANASFSGVETTQSAGLGGEFSSAYESSSLSSQYAVGTAIGGASSSGYDSAAAINTNGSDPATAAFLAADLNKDGSLDPNEFRQFLSAQLRNQQ